MKILFINPESVNEDHLPIPPLGILYLAAYIRERGFPKVNVLDNDLEKLNEGQLEERIKGFDVICFTGTTAQHPAALRANLIAKKLGKFTIYGGPHASALPEECVRLGFDLVVVGEGENTLLCVLDVFDSKDFSGVRNVAYKDKSGKIVKTDSARLIRDLDLLPFPARDLIDMSKYGRKELKRFNGPYTHLMTSRGCPSKCTFCNSPNFWRVCRLRSAANVFKEMMWLYKEYGISNFHYQDDTFTINKNRIMKLCKLIDASGIKFEWSAQTRVTAINRKLLRTMKKSGLVQLEIGVESGNDDILKTARKGYTVKQIRKAVKIAKEEGITLYGFFLIGLPGETLKSYFQTIMLAKELGLNSSVFTVLVPFPDTQIYQENLVEILEPDYNKWLYKSPVIKSGNFGPTSLKIMRWLADRLVNGFFNTGTYKEGL